MSLTAGKVTLSQIRTDARSLADMVASQFVTDAEFDRFIQAEYATLYDLLVQKYGNNYYVATPYSFTTDGTSEQYALPTDFYKLLGVDLKLGSNAESYVTVRPFNFSDRNRYAAPNLHTLYGLTNLRYRINGDNLWFTPRPAAGQTIRMWYVPRIPKLTSSTATLVFSGVAPAIGTLTINGTAITLPNTGTPTGDATSLAATLTGMGYAATSGGTSTVTMTISAQMVYWSTTSAYLTLSPAGAFSDYVDGVSGWEDYISIGAAVRALQKEESDPSALMARQQEIIRRIESAAENRDAGSPATVSDTQGVDGWGGSWPGGPW